MDTKPSGDTACAAEDAAYTRSEREPCADEVVAFMVRRSDLITELKAEVERLLEAFSTPLSQDESDLAEKAGRWGIDVEDPYAVTRAVEQILSERRQALEGEPKK